MKIEKTIKTENTSEEMLNYCGAVLISGKRYSFHCDNEGKDGFVVVHKNCSMEFQNGDIYEFVAVRENGSMEFQNEEGYIMIDILTFWKLLGDGQIERVDEPVTRKRIRI